MTNLKTTAAVAVSSGQVHCAMCTHTVEAAIVSTGKRIFVKSGQQCPRCGGLLDAAYVLRYDRAA